MEKNVMLIVPVEEWETVKKTLQQVLQVVEKLRPAGSPVRGVVSPYITAKEFMAAVRICRSNFDKLVGRGRIKTIKKGRKVYVVASEVERYFREVEV